MKVALCTDHDTQRKNLRIALNEDFFPCGFFQIEKDVIELSFTIKNI